MLEVRRFPDRETYLRLRSNVTGPDVALFADGALDALRSVSADVVSSDTIAHPTNRVPIASELAGAIKELTGPNGARRISVLEGEVR